VLSVAVQLQALPERLEIRHRKIAPSSDDETGAMA
jgi:hypothetical protein